MAFTMAAADLATLKALPGGDRLSPELLLILALVVFDGYELFPKSSCQPSALSR